MKDYKPTIGGSVVRNSNMLENYLLQDLHYIKPLLIKKFIMLGMMKI